MVSSFLSSRLSGFSFQILLAFSAVAVQYSSVLTGGQTDVRNKNHILAAAFCELRSSEMIPPPLDLILICVVYCVWFFYVSFFPLTALHAALVKSFFVSPFLPPFLGQPFGHVLVGVPARQTAVVSAYLAGTVEEEVLRFIGPADGAGVGDFFRAFRPPGFRLPDPGRVRQIGHALILPSFLTMLSAMSWSIPEA